MRVLETKSPDPNTMVKRKHKLRKQGKSVEVAGSDSSDDGGTEQHHSCKFTAVCSLLKKITKFNMAKCLIFW